MCNPGEHAHSDGKGGWRGCHKISEKHRDPATLQAHMDALNGGGVKQKIDEIKVKAEHKKVIDEDSPNGQLLAELGYEGLVGKDYVGMFKTMVGKIKGLRLISKILPLGAFMTGLDKMADIFGRLQDVRATEDEKKGFAEGWNAVDSMFDADMNPEEVGAVVQQIRDKLDEIKNSPKALKSGTRQHGMYMALKSFVGDYDAMNDKRVQQIIQDYEQSNVTNNTRSLYEGLNKDQKKLLKVLIGAHKQGRGDDVLASLPKEYQDTLGPLFERYKQLMDGQPSPTEQRKLSREFTEATRGLTPEQKRAVIQQARMAHRHNSDPSYR